MRVAHRELEDARRDPEGFLRERIRSQQEARGGPSAVRFWQLSVYVFHREGQDLTAAARYLEEVFRGTFVSGAVLERRIQQYVGYLEAYAREFAGLGRVVVQTGLRVKAVLTSDVEVTGEVNRVDLPLRGYAFCLLAKARPADWRRQLRMPLLQGVVAERLGVGSDMVETGVYSLDSATHEWHSYPAQEVRRAFEEARQVGERISQVAKRVGLIT